MMDGQGSGEARAPGPEFGERPARDIAPERAIRRFVGRLPGRSYLSDLAPPSRAQLMGAR